MIAPPVYDAATSRPLPFPPWNCRCSSISACDRRARATARPALRANAANAPAHAQSTAALDPRPSFARRCEERLRIDGRRPREPRRRGRDEIDERAPLRLARRETAARRRRRSASSAGNRRRGSARSRLRRSGRARARRPALRRARHTRRARRACRERARRTLSRAPHPGRARSSRARARPGTSRSVALDLSRARPARRRPSAAGPRRS